MNDPVNHLLEFVLREMGVVGAPDFRGVAVLVALDQPIQTPAVMVDLGVDWKKPFERVVVVPCQSSSACCQPFHFIYSRTVGAHTVMVQFDDVVNCLEDMARQLEVGGPIFLIGFMEGMVKAVTCGEVINTLRAAALELSDHSPEFRDAVNRLGPNLRTA